MLVRVPPTFIPRWFRQTVFGLVLTSMGCGAVHVASPASETAPEEAPLPSAAAQNAGTYHADAIVRHGAVDLPASVAPASSALADAVREPQPYHQPLPPKLRDRTVTPALQLATLSPGACRSRIRKDKHPAKAASRAPGVATPFRLVGPFHGVTFRGPGPKSIHSVMDCRLVLTLEAFAKVLARHGVIEVFYGNTFRRGAHLPGQKRKPSQHAHGLAIDIVWFKLADKSLLRVEDDYHGQRGKPSCGPDAWMTEPTPQSIQLRNIVCDVAREGVFNHMLTPNFDAAHASHLHFDIKRDDPWVSIR